MIELSLQNLKTYTKSARSENQILEALPFLGLDIEKVEGDAVSVEYSPNRPDFCSEAGIVRALLGQLGIKTGLPKYKFPKGDLKVSVVGTGIKKVRPFIFCLRATMGLTDPVIKQLISAQEDLHNGLGRRRSAVAIGLHDAEKIKGPIKYFASSDPNYSFIPLGASESKSIQSIIKESDQGRQYGRLLGEGHFPLLVDDSETVLSMPPIINGEATRLKPGTTSLFVDVTATNRRAGEATIAVLASMISDLGGKVEAVMIEEKKVRWWTPDMTETTMKFDLGLTNRILGLKLSRGEARRALQKSRLDLATNIDALIPRYRSDILHKIDLVEEVVLGYGVASLQPERISTSITGSLSTRSKNDERIADVFVGLGLTEIAGFALRSSYTDAFGPDLNSLKVENPKSASYEYLLSDAMPVLLTVLAECRREEYPQKLFEQLPAFKKSENSETGVTEESHVAVVLADSKSNFTMASSVLSAFLRTALGASAKLTLESKETHPEWFAKGRTARVIVKEGSREVEIGLAGEISPKALDALGLEVPVSGFELNLEPLLTRLGRGHE